MPGFAFPFGGSLRPRFPTFSVRSSFSLTIGTMLRYDCHLPFSGHFAFSYRFPIPRPLPFICVPFPACRLDRKTTRDTEALVQPVPFIFWRFWWEAGGSPKFPSCPLDTCPVLGSRWYPVDSPYRLQDCCLPQSECVGFPSFSWLSFCPQLCSISGFYDTAYILALLSFTRPLLVLHVSFATDLLAGLWSDGI